MDKELMKWLAEMPKTYELAGSKQGDYYGQNQLKLFLKKVY